MVGSSRGGFGTSIVLLLFFFSGASALIYEVVWGRMLVLVFGGTSYAIATVLAAFMGGLALGSYLFGRLIDRRGNPLLLYGLLEGGIGVWALLVPALFGLLNSGYSAAYATLEPSLYTMSLLRFAMTFIVLLVPTTLMGGTLPVLMRLLTVSGSLVGRTSAVLYFANVSGAVSGTFTAGFALIPALGLYGTTVLAVAMNFAIAVLAVAFVRRGLPGGIQAGPAGAGRSGAGRAAATAAAASPVAKSPAGAAASRLSPTARSMVLVVYAVSGLTALAYEVVWTRTMVPIIGTTTYAFTTMLTTFLLGLALGSLIFSRLADRISNTQLLAALQLFVGLLALATIPVLGHLPELFVRLNESAGQGWWSQIGIRFLLCMLTMLPCTILLGATFPVVAKLYAGNVEGIGTDIGKMYAFNTVGAIAGSLIGGFVAIPLLGQEKAIMAAAGLNMLAALSLVGVGAGPTRRRAAIAGASVAGLILAAVLSGHGLWDKKVMNSGVYLYSDLYEGGVDMKERLEEFRLLYWDEGVDATVSVMEKGNLRSLRINGKTDGSNREDMLTQRMLGALPLLVHGRARTALLVGLATGASAGSMLRHPIERLDCAEMVRGMDEAAEVFSRVNYDCLEDDRFNLVVADGRNYLLLTDRSYDVIVCQVSSPWVRGCASLYTVEFYELARRHLNPGGVISCWVQYYSMSAEDLALTLNTMQSVFPHVTVWGGEWGDLVLLGSVDRPPLEYQGIVRAMRRPGVREDLESVSVAEPAGLFSCFMLDPEGLARYLSGTRGLITDDKPVLEFSMPRSIGAPAKDRFLEISAYRSPPAAYLGEGLPDSVRAELEDAFRARDLSITAKLGIDEGVRADPSELTHRALEINPHDPWALEMVSKRLFGEGTDLAARGNFEAAIAVYDVIMRLGYPSWAMDSAVNSGLCHVALGDTSRGLALWESVREGSPDANYYLGSYYWASGRIEGAFAAYEKAIELDPYALRSVNDLARLLVQQGADLDRALALALRSSELDPEPRNLDTLGWVYYARGELDKAVETLEERIDAWGPEAECLYLMGLAYADQGRRDSAREALTRSAELDGQGMVRAQALEALRRL